MFCFSYGSNLSSARIRSRVPSAEFVAVGTLREHALRFHKAGSDGSGKCDAEFTGNRKDRVMGVVWEIGAADKRVLDRIEGLGAGYREEEVEVVTADGRSLAARMYVATDTDPSRKPYRWYKAHVLAGARENGLPSEYVAGIEAVEAIEDPDTERSGRESAIYY